MDGALSLFLSGGWGSLTEWYHRVPCLEGLGFTSGSLLVAMFLVGGWCSGINGLSWISGIQFLV